MQSCLGVQTDRLPQGWRGSLTVVQGWCRLPAADLASTRATQSFLPTVSSPMVTAPKSIYHSAGSPAPDSSARLPGQPCLEP